MVRPTAEDPSFMRFLVSQGKLYMRWRADVPRYGQEWGGASSPRFVSSNAFFGDEPPVFAHVLEGGLLARTLVTDSGDALWNSTFAIPISEIPPETEQLPQLRRVFYFQPKSYVKRVIFIAVPHRGSRSADRLFGRFVATRVHLPHSLNAFVGSLKRILKLHVDELSQRKWNYPADSVRERALHPRR